MIKNEEMIKNGKGVFVLDKKRICFIFDGL